MELRSTVGISRATLTDTPGQGFGAVPVRMPEALRNSVRDKRGTFGELRVALALQCLDAGAESDLESSRPVEQAGRVGVGYVRGEQLPAGDTAGGAWLVVASVDRGCERNEE